MAVTSTETEIKYEAAAGAALPAFAQLAQVARAEEAEQEDLAAEYFDTDDLRLLRAGITLRRRQGGHDAGWHLKLPAGDHSRREIRLPLGRATRRVPAELERRVRVHVRGNELKPVARISTTRTRLLLVGGDGASLAEVASDDVTAEALGETPRASRWHEVEVELTGGDRELLEAADELLQRSGLRRGAQSAKLARALDLPPSAAGPRQPADANAAAGDVLLCYLDGQIAGLKAWDPMVRGDEPDAVHQMRTTTRRLRSTLQTFLPFFSRAQADQLIAELRWLGGELGKARDAEVLAAELDARLRDLPAQLVVGPVQARVRGHFAGAAASAHAAVLKALDSPRYFTVLDLLDELADRPSGTGLATRPARKVLRRPVRRTYRRVARRMRHALRQTEGERADVALHEARKAAKRARYAGEAAAPAFGADAARFAKRMKKVQSVLGARQDAVIARAAARELGMLAQLSGENAFSYGIVHQREDHEAGRLRVKAERAWRSASRPRVRRWLA